MQKVERRQWMLFLLPCLWLLLALLLAMAVETLTQLVGGTPRVLAANRAPLSNKPDCTSEHFTPSFRSSVVIAKTELVCSDLTAFGGTVVINGEVRGKVVVFGGDVVINGTVDGDINVYGGQVTLQNTAHVDGNIHRCGGQWSEGTNSQLHGSVFGCPKSAMAFLIADEGPQVRFWSVLAWIILGLGLTSLLPEHVMLIRTTAKIKTRRSLALGLLSTLLAPVILAVAIALIISIPLAIFVVLGLLAAWALGTVAVGWLIGEYVLRSLVPQKNTRQMQVAVGLTVLILAESLPYIGWLISIGAGLIGLGAVFLSRFGTRLYSQPRQPLT